MPVHHEYLPRSLVQKIKVYFDTYPGRKALSFLGLPLLALFLFSKILENVEVPFIFISAVSLYCIFIFIAHFVLIINKLLLLCLKQLLLIDIRRVNKNFRTSFNTSHFNYGIYMLIPFQIAYENLIFRV